ncbi:MAG: SPFH/Band 7/PHB domain protein [Mesoaciditoga sp.]|uniref:SPFH domain-containing protein n=1 Tax=Athalassotoga sp. TaxID=2022597 RepID=UPI000CB1E853|nr:MAG: SPFH/Band 7/PHB domain protein [Mesoaciditoga sp.]PMP80661.1 MAG: SPFH/Band 7/PHB domain protein [Mesoaciditoga sp.]HEU24112.1 SPFH/Band 7/PHB domain protein [Mesoaciditoga lauensis]
MILGIIIGVIIAAFLIIVAITGIKIVRPFQRGLIERLGKFSREAQAGLHLIIPFFEKMTKIDMREHFINVPPQEVITRDNVVVSVDAVIYYQVSDAFKVNYNVKAFEPAATMLAQTNLRNVIGELELDQTLTSREMINAKLRDTLDEATDKWGVRITRVEIKKIDPPKDITEAMSQQMKAERTKRAAILEAEGIKQSQILQAEGQKQSQILKAEGDATAIQRIADAQKYKFQTEAEGQAAAIKIVFDAIHSGNPTPDLITIRYLEALQQIANGQATKIFLPFETSGVLSSLGAMAEVFKSTPKEGSSQI